MLFRKITDAVGNNLKNTTEDVQTVKRNLARFGLFDEEDHGYITRKMDNGIKTFQKDNDLKVDGRLYPGGETERTMYEKLSGNSADDYFGAQDEDYGTVGFGGNVSGTLEKRRIPKPKRKPERIMHSIDTFFPELSGKEKGYTSGKTSPNAIDRRGATNIGINRYTLVEFQGWKQERNEKLPDSFTTDIRKIQPELARQIYDEMFYKKYNINKVSDEQTAGHILDMSILNGSKNAVKWYQKALNAQFGKNIKEDGVLGSRTRKAIEEAKETGVLRNINNAVVQRRIQAFIKQAEEDHTQKGFLEGWLDRARSFIMPPLPKRKPL